MENVTPNLMCQLGWVTMPRWSDIILDASGKGVSWIKANIQISRLGIKRVTFSFFSYLLEYNCFTMLF